MHAAAVIRRLFALPERTEPPAPVPAAAVDAAWPEPGEITLITGGSGGGKSRLLAALRERGRSNVQWIEPHAIPLGDTCVVDLVCDELEGLNPPVKPAGPVNVATSGEATGNAAGDATDNAKGDEKGDAAGEAHVEAALELLSRVGLAEAWTYLQKPAELSDGQRWRLRLALAVARGLRRAGAPPSPTSPGQHAGAASGDHSAVFTIIAIDEFAAVLDRVTARIVARALRRLIDRPGRPPVAAIVVTSHDDLRIALSPDRKVTADFGRYLGEDATPR